MTEIFEIDDLQTLDRFAKKEGYTGLGDYLPTIHTWNIPVDVAAELIRKGISFSEYSSDPSLLTESLPEKVIPIANLYRARDERIAEIKKQCLEERICAQEQKSLPKKRPFLQPLFYSIASGLAAAAVLIGLSSLPNQKYPLLSEASLIHNPLCTSIEGLYVCTDQSEHGQFFGSYWQYRQLKNDLKLE